MALAVGGALALTGDDPPARAAAPGSGSEWCYYVYDRPGGPDSWGAEVGPIGVPFLSAHAKLTALRTNDASGTEQGGGSQERFSVIGLVVQNPRPGYEYSWEAESDLGKPKFTAEVTLSDLGFVAGRAEGSVTLRMYGDLLWSCERHVAARDFEGGNWQIGWPPSYTPPGSGDAIAYRKGRDVKGLQGQDRDRGADGHVQVRWLSRIHGDLMAHSQWGLDRRSASSSLRLAADARLDLRGFSKPPVEPGEPARPPYLSGWLQVSLSTVTNPLDVDEREVTKLPLPPEETEKGNHDDEDFRSNDW
jgi:hypothetical protein